MPFSTLFQLYCSGQCTYPYLSRLLLTSTPHNILSKPLAAFPHNHCLHNRQQWERNESCCNDYHQSSERKLAEPGIKPTERWGSADHNLNITQNIQLTYCKVEKIVGIGENGGDQHFLFFPLRFQKAFSSGGVKSCQCVVKRFVVMNQ